MSHIIIKAKIEEVKHKLLEYYNVFEGHGDCIVIVEKESYELPVVFRKTKEGVLIKVANGSYHIDQRLIQEVISQFLYYLNFPVVRGSVSSKFLKR